MKLNELTQGLTDRKGNFRLEYVSSTESPHLLVQVYPPGADSRANLLASVLRTRAAPEETIQMTIEIDKYRGPSEFERLHNVLDGIVRGDSEELDDDSVAILAAEVQIPPQDVRAYHRAKKLAASTGHPLPVAFALSQLSTRDDLGDLFARGGRSGLKRSLEGLIKQNRVPQAIAASVEKIVNDLYDKHIEQNVDNKEGFGGLLDASGIADLSVKKTIAALRLEHGSGDAFWDPQAGGRGQNYRQQPKAHLELTNWLAETRWCALFGTNHDFSRLAPCSLTTGRAQSIGKSGRNRPATDSRTNESSSAAGRRSFSTAVWLENG
jgi:hypothetical protein